MQVDVTQADREAYLAMNMLPEFDAADVRAGLWDKVTGLQAFARHRIQAVRDQADEIARLREERRGLVEALANLLPTKLCGEGWGLPDSETVSIVVTFGKLKAARAMIDAIGEPQP